MDLKKLKIEEDENRKAEPVHYLMLGNHILPLSLRFSQGKGEPIWKLFLQA